MQTITPKTNTLVHVTTVHVTTVTNWPTGRRRDPKMTAKEAVLVAEKLDFEFDFGVAQRFTAAITGLCSVPASAAERHGPAVQIRAPRPIPDSRYFPAPAGFRTAVFRSSAAIMR